VGVLLAVLAAVVIAAVFVGYKSMGFGGPTQQELALKTQAQQAEQNKDWPGALADYKNLANLSGKLANDARAQSARLQGLIDREASLFQLAQDSSLSGSLTEARDLYQQAADLHGDREQEAQDAIQKLDASMPPPAPAPAPVAQSAPPAPAAKNKAAAAKAQKRTAPAKRSAKSESEDGAASATADAAPKPAENPNCQLVASDLPRFLEMADSNRGRGKYSDAEREYGAVLECDSQNERAKNGLARAKEAEAISGVR